jgi:hypothetical protein
MSLLPKNYESLPVRTSQAKEGESQRFIFRYKYLFPKYFSQSKRSVSLEWKKQVRS